MTAGGSAGKVGGGGRRGWGVCASNDDVTTQCGRRGWRRLRACSLSTSTVLVPTADLGESAIEEATELTEERSTMRPTDAELRGLPASLSAVCRPA